MNDLDNYIKEAVTNIRKDRETAKDLLEDVIQYLKKDEERHREVGAIAAKYVETLQRSNEQLVKVATLIHKKSDIQDGLTDADKDELFELIKENG